MDYIIREVKEDHVSKDKLNRKDFLLLLDTMIKNIPGPYVININGDWGSGKSFFLKMLKQTIGKDCLYINTYENDYYDEPFTAIAGEIALYLKENGDMSELKNKVTDHIKDFCMVAGKNALPLVVSALLKNMFGEGAKEVLDVLRKSITDIGTSAIDNYEKRKKDLVGLKQSLKDYVQSLESKKLVILIDELDRCRPDYAMDMLEILKHLFDIEGILFVVATATERLIKSVESTYGIDDGYLYLRKYFHLNIDLPKVSHSEYIKWRLSSKESIFASKSIEPNVVKAIIDEMALLTDEANIKIRNIEESLNGFVTWMMINNKNCDPSYYVFVYYLCILNTKGILYLNTFKSQKSELNVHENGYIPSCTNKPFFGSIYCICTRTSLQSYESFMEKQDNPRVFWQRMVDLAGGLGRIDYDTFEAAKKNIHKFLDDFQVR